MPRSWSYCAWDSVGVFDVKWLGIILVLLTASFREAPRPVSQDGITVYFSPHGGCTEAVVERINGARKSIDVQAYSFTSTAIARALAEAEARGVKVRAVLDRKATGEHYSGGRYLADHGIAVWLDGAHPIAHNKVIILDGATVITGSFNFTRQAEWNAENLVVIEGRGKIAEAYEGEFERHRGHSEEMKGR